MSKFNFLYLFFLINVFPFLVVCNRLVIDDPQEDPQVDGNDLDWKGRWFPEKPKDYNHEKEIPSKDLSDSVDFQYLEDPPGHSMMPMIDPTCDNGKENLTLDWPKTPAGYTCVILYRKYFEPDTNLPAVIHRSFIPKAYKARHVCMNEEINYSSNIPTYGPHRAAWPRYGEYTYLPPQRWIHSLEHGAVVMLYHPCAHPFLVEKLRGIVQTCLYRHIITPYSQLPRERPLALLTWGWSLSLPDVYENVAVKFIREHALRGPEDISTDGQYDFQLNEPATFVTNPDDSDGLCPSYN